MTLRFQKSGLFTPPKQEMEQFLSEIRMRISETERNLVNDYINQLVTLTEATEWVKEWVPIVKFYFEVLEVSKQTPSNWSSN